MALADKGIDIRRTGGTLVFRALLQDSNGAILATGTTTFRLYELQSDGTLKSYDFNDNTFKTTALTTATLAATHRTGNNSTVNTGLWTATLGTLTGFTIGGIYFITCNNTGASPVDQVREFQYGSAEGDLVVTANGTGVGELDSNLVMLGGVVQSATDLKDFADDGYDPTTNKVQGVVLVDTVTTYTGNTPQTGDAYAVVNSGTFGNSALKTLIDAVDDYVDTEVAAIKAKTDNLPSDPADASDIAAAFATVNSTLSTIAGYVDTEVAAIKAKTDLLTFTGTDVKATLDGETVVPADGSITAAKIATDAIDADALSTDAVAEIAAKITTDHGSGSYVDTGAGGDATLANQTTLINRIGAFSGTGINTILGFLRAMSAKAAALTPSDLSTGTTYDNTDDSLEAIRDAGAAGLSQQNVRDAMGLTSTIGEESIDAKLNDDKNISVNQNG